MTKKMNMIDYLNQAIKNEMTSLHQYMLDAKLLEDWGLAKLSAIMDEEATDEVGHANMLMDRILSLKGIPNMQDIGTIKVTKNVKDMIENSLNHEKNGMKDLTEAIEYAESQKDYLSREIFLEILKEEQSHHDWLETQIDVIEKIGIDRYTMKAYTFKSGS